MSPEQIPYQDISRFSGAKSKAKESLTTIKTRTIETAHTAKEAAQHVLQNATEYAQVTGIAMGSIFAPTDMMNAHQAALDAMSKGNNPSHTIYTENYNMYDEALQDRPPCSPADENIGALRNQYQTMVKSEQDTQLLFDAYEGQQNCSLTTDQINSITAGIATPETSEVTPPLAPTPTEPQATATSEYEVLDPSDPNVITIPPPHGSEFEEDYYNNLNNPPVTNDENVSDMRKIVDSIIAFLDNFHPDNIGTSLVATATALSGLTVSYLIAKEVRIAKWKKTIKKGYKAKSTVHSTTPQRVVREKSAKPSWLGNVFPQSGETTVEEPPRYRKGKKGYINLGDTEYNPDFTPQTKESGRGRKIKVTAKPVSERSEPASEYVDPELFDLQVTEGNQQPVTRRIRANSDSFMVQARTHLKSITGMDTTGGYINPPGVSSRGYIEFDFPKDHGLSEEDLSKHINYDVKVTGSNKIRIYPGNLRE